MFFLGIDLGGTNIAAGVIDENYNIVGRGKMRTNLPRPAEQIVEDMATAARMAIENAGLKMSDIKEIGIGSPGSIDPVNGVVTYSNNLGFSMLPLREMMEKRLNIKVFLDNDANAAAFGEQLAGAGKGTKDFVAVTLGTGVGGGVIVGGKMLTGFNFAGGELGHTVILMDGVHCTCGRNGCWEAYASATALVRQTREAMQKDVNSKMWGIVSGNLEYVNGRTAFDGMRAGDKSATDVVTKYFEYVACGITNIVNIFQPEIICIGGGISKEGETLLTPIRELIEADRYSRNTDEQTVIKAAELGNDAGIIGAAFLGNLYR
ncbi:MAG: ROK family protein [Oscillospiraceae bacterium]|nr:ROK family protein [Oscillospiraceae bacterium]